MGREEILKRIRTAESVGEEFELPSGLPRSPEYPDPVKKFQEELTLLEGVFLTASSGSEIRSRLEKILKENSASSLAWENKEVIDTVGCTYPPKFQFSSEDFFTCSLHEDHRVNKRLNVINFDRNREELPGIEISVSLATAGIAETGSIVESLGKGKSRIMPILAPVHVALLPVEKLVGSQLDFFSSFHPGETGSAEIIMSGASRTADIEKTLIVGVHGPKKLYVILLQ